MRGTVVVFWPSIRGPALPVSAPLLARLLQLMQLTDRHSFALFFLFRSSSSRLFAFRTLSNHLSLSLKSQDLWPIRPIYRPTLFRALARVRFLVRMHFHMIIITVIIIIFTIIVIQITLRQKSLPVACQVDQTHSFTVHPPWSLRTRPNCSSEITLDSGFLPCSSVCPRRAPFVARFAFQITTPSTPFILCKWSSTSSEDNSPNGIHYPRHPHPAALVA